MIWLELVWLFDPSIRGIRSRLADEELARAPLPLGVAGPATRPLAGIVAGAGKESYFLLDPAENGGGQSGSKIQTYAVDASGEIRPGAWTYGSGENDLSVYGEPKTAQGHLAADQKDQALLDAYLRAIE